MLQIDYEIWQKSTDLLKLLHIRNNFEIFKGDLKMINND